MQFIRNFAKKYNDTSLIVRILIGLALGTVLALLVPDAGWIGIFGSLFVGALKGIAPVLVFVIVSSALAQRQAGSPVCHRHLAVPADHLHRGGTGGHYQLPVPRHR